jgi:hypothetical protein
VTQPDPCSAGCTSRQVGLPPSLAEAGLDDACDICPAAYRLKCKGITIYRYGLKPQQLLSIGQGDPATLASPRAGDFSPHGTAGTCDF